MRLWKPALFSTPMVQTILDGHKTMTRRVTRPQPDEDPGRPLAVIGDLLYRWVAVPARATSPMAPERAGFAVLGNHKPIRCPWPVRTRLWVRETTALVYNGGGMYCADGATIPGWTWRYSRDVCPTIHMPRDCARIGLEVTAVRCERVQDITEADAVAEGVDAVSVEAVPRQAAWSRRQDFAALWDSLNAKRGYGWAVNPHVFAYGFKLLSTDAETQRLMTEDAK